MTGVLLLGIGVAVGALAGGAVVAVVVRARSSTLTAALDRLGRGELRTRVQGKSGALAAFDRAAETLAREGSDLRNQVNELEQVLDAAPLAMVLCDNKGLVTRANRTARDLFNHGRPLVGEMFESILASCPPDLANVVRSQSDVLVTIDVGGDEEAYHLSRPSLSFGLHRHTLYLVTQLTRELSRQEVAIWKKVIRVIGHEIRNSLAPISSLVRSARLIAQNPEQAHRLETVFDTIAERAKHLEDFVNDYARFARLPEPEKEAVDWMPFLEGLAGLMPYDLPETAPTEPGFFDRAQLQQALINLLKNAREAKSTSTQITVKPGRDGGVQLSVLDNGTGMSDESLHQALLPFYSTKKSGSGLGLALCREIVEAHSGSIRLEHRENGGIAVRIWLPGRNSQSSFPGFPVS